MTGQQSDIKFIHL